MGLLVWVAAWGRTVIMVIARSDFLG